jgi:hypothetical protein
VGRTKDLGHFATEIKDAGRRTELWCHDSGRYQRERENPDQHLSEEEKTTKNWIRQNQKWDSRGKTKSWVCPELERDPGHNILPHRDRRENLP